MIGVLEQNQVPRFVGLETVAFRAPQTPCHAITMPQMMQMMHLAFLASPPLKNHLQHNLKKPSLDVPSLRVPFPGHPPKPPNYSLRSPDTTPLAPSTKAGFRHNTNELKTFRSI